LLENLRIEATLIVLCLSSTATYRCIINGDADVRGRVDDILGEDQWWIDLKRLRRVSSSSSPTAANAFRQASLAFVNSLADISPASYSELIPGVLARRGSNTSSTRLSVPVALPKRRQSMAVLPPSFTMRMGVNNPDFFNPVSSESSSEGETDGSDTDSEPESDVDDEVASDEHEDATEQPQETDYFSSHEGGSSSQTPGKSPLDEIEVGKRAAFSASAHASLDVDDEDKPHVSFKATLRPPHRSHQCPELELNFNILPAKAQYLILNDLIRSHSEDTAVVFTTLPAPAPGTYQDEEKSLEYVSGLELLCEDIPPVLLIHSNSLVVTLAL
jgi:solute carrier family 12 (potassium/chloride transporters), member 9